MELTRKVGFCMPNWDIMNIVVYDAVDALIVGMDGMATVDSAINYNYAP